MSPISRFVVRARRGLVYSAILLRALLHPVQRRLLGEVLALARRLPGILEQPLPVALAALTPELGAEPLEAETTRRIIDALTGFGAGRPLGICLRRSLLRYYFLRRAGLPLVVHFGARRKVDGIGGHAWLTLHGQPFHEHPENYQGFTLMFSYPPHAH